jgi:hypothetical protein
MYIMSKIYALPRPLWLPLICDLILNDASDVHVVQETGYGQMQCTLDLLALGLICYCQDGLRLDWRFLHQYLH